MIRYKTLGIVLKYIKYSETSIIAYIFTELFGRQSYIIQGVRAKKPRYHIALFQPLMPLDMVVYHKKQANIQRIAEVQCYVPMHNIFENTSKAAIATFLAELLLKVLHEEVENINLFRFLLRAVVTLNKQKKSYEIFHLRFMLQLCSYLGFGIKTAEEIDQQLCHAGMENKFSQEEIALINTLLAGRFAQDTISHKHTRKNLTAGLVKFYQLHIDSLDTLNAFKVLQSI